VIDANRGTFTHLTTETILELRRDVDLLGVALSITGSNWIANKYDWTKGTTIALPNEKRLWMSYITDLRTACEELSTAASVSAPDWTPGGVGVETVDLDPLFDSAGDVIDANRGSYTDVRLASLYTTVQNALSAVAETLYYFVNAQTGNDTTGDGSRDNPYQTWDKVVNIANGAAGDIYLMERSDGARAVYTVTSTTLTAANIKITGAGTDLVILDNPVGASQTLANANNQTWEDIFFGNGGSQGLHINTNKTGQTFTNCAFYGGGDPAFSGHHIAAIFNHCTFICDNSANVFQRVGNNNITFNDCCFVGGLVGIRAYSSGSGTITFNYCAWYDVTDKWTTSTSVTFVNNNMFSESIDPEILDNSICYLSDASQYKGEASDSFDIGAYTLGPYNVIRSASDGLTLSETTDTTSIGFASDTLSLHEDLSTVNMNVSVDLALWGLFESSISGVITYYTEAYMDTRSGFMADHIANWEYNGATLDLSWDNAGGDTCEVHIAVDDGSTDYDPVAWWEVNALNPSASTTDAVGPRGYALSCYLDTELDEEWGDQGDLSTVAADGENDQQWDITLKVRIKNTVTGQWSEVVELIKTYNFNTFADTMYYLADNPRSVDGEYANHANYLAQPYHTGTNKYTRIDGVDWVDDNRRYAYNPHVKSLHHTRTKTGQIDPVQPSQAYGYWKDRYTSNFQPFGEANARAILDLYPCIFSNYGNYNNGVHCFTSTGNIINDNGSYESDVPIMGDSAQGGSPSNIPYLFLTGYIGTDCLGHSSARGFFVWMPSGEILGHDPGGARGDVNDVDTDLYFQTIQYSTCPPARFYLRTIKRDPGGTGYWWFSKAEIMINEDDSNNPDTGFMKFNASHDADSGPF
jgi:hypothetical protein